jgi:hypothetical protein
MNTNMAYRSDLKRATSAALLVLLCEVAGGGCSSGAPYAESSKTEATVTGHVTFQGKPVTKGQVAFNPTNINRPGETSRFGEIRKDGTYELTTLIGDNLVTLAIPSQPKKKGGTPRFQKIYYVKVGSNTLDIESP